MVEKSDQKMQIVYLSHGGGPLPILGDPGHAAMVAFMKNLPEHIYRPDAVIVVSAHWEEPQATTFSASNVPLFYDYYGFPGEAYSITYPAPGDPNLVKRIRAVLEQAGMPTEENPDRGLDHGGFIPLKMAFSEADIPVVQLSLLSGLDPAAHIALGRGLQALQSENILVMGSGFSFHNLRAFFDPNAAAPDARNEAFQDWLIETCTGDLPQAEREARLTNWEQAPGARYCHPREEHLLPLHVCTGLANAPAKLIFDDAIMGKRGVAFLWG